VALILAVVSQACSKASVAHFIMAISPHRITLLLCRCIMVTIVLWVVTAVPAFAAQCNSPKPWIVAPGRCINLKALHIYVGVINVLTDAVLIALPVYLVNSIDIVGRWSIMTLFSVRSMYVLSTIVKARANPAFDAPELSFSQ
jgi:hypothetical protein